jgi:DNA-binding MarR family transcriptional regulator
MIGLEEPPTGISGKGVERLADIIMSLQRCFIQQLSEELGRGQVSFPQFFLLGLIHSSNDMSMSEIANRMGHTTAAATGLVDRLENLGYVQRSHDPVDRRKVLVAITPKGVTLVRLIRDDIVKNLSSMMERLTPGEQRSWLEIYEKIFAYCQQKGEG